MNIEELYEKTEKLQVYADLCDNETGELLTKLCGLVSGILDYSSQNFQDAVAQEIGEQLVWFETNTTIVETEREVIMQPIIELEYLH